MSSAVLILGLCSVGYAFINFEDVSRHSAHQSSITLTVKQPYSIIDVSTLSGHVKDITLTLSTVRGI